MDYAQQQRNPGKHVLSIALVLLLHLVVGYALVTGLARKIVDVIKKPIETKIVEEHRPPPPPEAPPPPPPKIDVPPPPFIPPPEIQVAVAPPPQATITQVTTKAPPPAPAMRPTPAPVAAPAQHTTVRGSLDRSTCASVDPPYPMSSRRNQESGSGSLKIQLDAAGNLVKVEVEHSTSHSRLDESARNWASACKFKPTTVDGAPVAGTFSLPFTFKLTD